MTRVADVLANAWFWQRQPLSLVHFVTQRCNARCSHCFINFDAPAAAGDPLDIGEIEAIASRLDGALVNVNVTGGEPFLERELWPICRAWLRGAGVASVYITTHGGFPERIADLVDAFLAENFVGQHLFISISLDNFAAEHDRSRRVDGLFAKAMESHAWVKARNDPRVGVGVSITVAAHNSDQVVPLYQHLRDECGIEIVTATLVRGQGVQSRLDDAVRRRVGEAYAALTREIEADLARMRRSGARRSLVARMQDAKDGLLYRMLREDAVEGSRYRSSCPAGGLFIVVLPDGEVHGCEVRTDASLGKLREHGLDLPALLAAPQAAAWRSEIRATRCHCTYECALGINIVSHPRHLPALVSGLLRTVRKG